MKPAESGQVICVTCGWFWISCVQRCQTFSHTVIVIAEYSNPCHANTTGHRQCCYVRSRYFTDFALFLMVGSDPVVTMNRRCLSYTLLSPWVNSVSNPVHVFPNIFYFKNMYPETPTFSRAELRTFLLWVPFDFSDTCLSNLILVSVHHEQYWITVGHTFSNLHLSILMIYNLMLTQSRLLLFFLLYHPL